MYSYWSNRLERLQETPKIMTCKQRSTETYNILMVSPCRHTADSRILPSTEVKEKNDMRLKKFPTAAVIHSADSAWLEIRFSSLLMDLASFQSESNDNRE